MKQDKARRLMLIQHIVVTWTKVSRGAPGSVARNRVPEVYALPVNPPGTLWPARSRPPAVLPPPDTTDTRAPDIFLHFVACNESNQFQDPIAQFWITLTSRLPEVSTLRLHRNVPLLTLTSSSDALQVTFSWHEVPGAPSRHHKHMRERVALATGQWMQVRFNGRHRDSDGHWYYQKHVFNIGIADAFVPTLFVSGGPAFRLTDLADLR